MTQPTNQKVLVYPRAPISILISSVIRPAAKDERGKEEDEEVGVSPPHPAMSAHQSTGVAHPRRWWNYNIRDKREPRRKTGIKETGRIAPEAFTFITNLIHLPLLSGTYCGRARETQMQLNLSENLMRQFLPTRRSDLLSFLPRCSVTNKTETGATRLCDADGDLFYFFEFRFACVCAPGRDGTRRGRWWAQPSSRGDIATIYLGAGRSISGDFRTKLLFVDTIKYSDLLRVEVKNYKCVLLRRQWNARYTRGQIHSNPFLRS